MTPVTLFDPPHDLSPHQVTNCTVHGGWTAWSSWSQCSANCGIAVKTRRRTCSNPAPKHGGRVCVGQERTEIYCHSLPRCPCKLERGGGGRREEERKKRVGEGLCVCVCWPGTFRNILPFFASLQRERERERERDCHDTLPITPQTYPHPQNTPKNTQKPSKTSPKHTAHPKNTPHPKIPQKLPNNTPISYSLHSLTSGRGVERMAVLAVLLSDMRGNRSQTAPQNLHAPFPKERRVGVHRLWRGD
ncbi:Semaphorin-5A [Portunus trituberculatus]|uniref:Semaphorin-5A n=1 Tax=Portunus trituberculatus TaxID=210409 RepID=A0A5B7J558_PORTR|nr:Semaphorin-5A [Portunus trituberculatus]